jgi:hypothetical protein
VELITSEYLKMDPSNGAVVVRDVSDTQPSKDLTLPPTLCWKCSRLDFDWIFRTSTSPKYNGEIYQEYSFNHFTSHNECPLCRIITYMVSKSKVIEEARRSTIILNFQHSHSYVDIKTGLRNYLPKLLVGLKTNDFGYGPFYIPPSLEGMDGLPGQIQLILEPTLGDQTGSPNSLLFGRRVFEYAELTVMKRWLDICNGFHSEKCNSVRHTSSIVGNFAIRAIDVENRSITSIDISSQYVALSYVWGGKEVPQLKLQESTFKRLSSSGGLKGGDIPTTISDSMRVCQVLGRRYLWVDALCIMQDDPEEQASQIREMHKIYANAEFTIVAAGGPNSWTGLPGISKREILQHIENVQERVLPGSMAGSLPTFQDSIMDSPWSTRAWTLQEMYFSRRLLYFTRAQIYFQCDEYLWQEDKILECIPAALDTEIVRPPRPLPIGWSPKRRPSARDLKGPPYPPPSDIRYLLKHSSRGYEMPPMLQYQDLAQTYSQRRLTNGSDILNGFAGIMQSFSELMNWEFLYGLPTAFFDSALLFERRDLRCQFHDTGFPSWSWSGWAEGSEPLMTPLPGIRYDEKYRVFRENKWYRVQAGQYVEINNSEVRESPFKWAAWRQSKVSELGPVPCELTRPERERLLVFQASSAFMVVTPGTSWPWPPWRGNCDSACSIALSADGQRQLTQIRETFDLSAICDPENTTKEVEFVVVASCEAKPEPIPGSPGWDQESLREGPLKLMAIETDQRGMSKRIDVAEQAVEITEWLAYEPKWRTVFML